MTPGNRPDRLAKGLERCARRPADRPRGCGAAGMRMSAARVSGRTLFVAGLAPRRTAGGRPSPQRDRSPRRGSPTSPPSRVACSRWIFRGAAQGSKPRRRRGDRPGAAPHGYRRWRSSRRRAASTTSRRSRRRRARRPRWASAVCRLLPATGRAADLGGERRRPGLGWFGPRPGPTVAAFDVPSLAIGRPDAVAAKGRAPPGRSASPASWRSIRSRSGRSSTPSTPDDAEIRRGRAIVDGYESADGRAVRRRGGG